MRHIAPNWLPLVMAVSASLWASDPKPVVPDLTSLSTSRRREGDQARHRSFDETTLRIEAILANQDLSAFVKYHNHSSHVVHLTLNKFAIGEDDEFLAVESDGTATTLNLKDNDSFTVAPGGTAYVASRKPIGEPFANACFGVSDGGGHFSYLAMWFRPLAHGKEHHGKARLIELPDLGKVALANALENWERKQQSASQGGAAVSSTTTNSAE